MATTEGRLQRSWRSRTDWKMKKPYHALAVPSPFQGHIHPMLQLCKRFLVPAGFKVTIANTEVNHQRINATLSTQDMKSELVEFVSLDDGFSPELHDDLMGLVAASISTSMEAAVQRLLNRLEPPASCIVSDVRIVFTQDLANSAGIPRIALWTQSASHFASNHLMAHGYQLPPDDSATISCLYGVVPHKRSEINWVCRDDFPHFVKCTQEPFRRIGESMCIVINTFEELESNVLDGLEVKIGFRPLALGPLVDTSLFSIIKGISKSKLCNMDSLNSWLDNQPSCSVLYIAFGTLAKLSNEQMEELIHGLEASKQSIVCVFRPSMLVSNSNAIEHLQRLERLGVVLSWAPQWQILSHRAIGGFLTHCGWNSTMESISAGVPLLGWPQFGDQHLCKRCIIDQWKIGLGLESDCGLISRVEVENKVRKLMDKEGTNDLRENVRRLSTLAKKSLLEGHAYYEQFKYLLKIDNIHI